MLHYIGLLLLTLFLSILINHGSGTMCAPYSSKNENKNSSSKHFAGDVCSQMNFLFQTSQCMPGTIK